MSEGGRAPRAGAVIVAAGRGLRFGGAGRKQFLDLGGIPVLEWSVRAFRRHAEVGELVVVLPADEVEAPPSWLSGAGRLVVGGATRAESVARGVAVVPGTVDRILVHDGVRPFVSDALIARVHAACAADPAVPVLPVPDTIKEVRADGTVVGTPDRRRLRRVQTPQGFPAATLRRLHGAARPDAEITDDALLCERGGIPVRTVEGEPRNLKITSPEDLAYARWLVGSGLVERPRAGRAAEAEVSRAGGREEREEEGRVSGAGP